MEFKGTKGEWKSVKIEATEYLIERNEIHYGDDGECVAEFVSNDFDAQLIASAPELLEALQGLLEISKQSHHPSGDYARGKAKNAINKALGNESK